MTKVKMLSTQTGSPDGLSVKVYERDAEYDLPNDLLNAFRQMGCIQILGAGPGPDETKVERALETKEDETPDVDEDAGDGRKFDVDPDAPAGIPDDAAAATEGEQEEDPDRFKCLLGSDVQPSTFTLKDGSVLALGDVVSKAYDAAGCASIDEWNDLDGETREMFIADVVGNLDLMEQAA